MGIGDTGRTWRDVFGGVIPPMLSLLDEQREPDPEAIGLLIEHILAGGCGGLFVLGGYGEGAWLTGAQRGTVVRSAVAAAAGRVPVLAGVMLPATAAVCEAARQAEALGADAVVVGSPYYFPVDGDMQIRHVEAVLEAVQVPILLYNIPQCTHNTLRVETVAALASEPRVFGIKDSAGDAGAFRGLLAIKERHPAFRVLQGNGDIMLTAPSLLGDGLVPGLANIAPHLFVGLFDAAKRGDGDTVARFQAGIADLCALERVGPHFLAAGKAACRALGFGSGQPTLPLARAGDAELQAIAAIVQRSQAARAVAV